ncbi:MAG: hypothetical protein ACFB03_19765 [Paracoccaceae bacterium]
MTKTNTTDQISQAAELNDDDLDIVSAGGSARSRETSKEPTDSTESHGGTMTFEFVMPKGSNGT